MPLNSALSPAMVELGFGSTLPQQMQDETEEQRRRRLLLEQMQQAVSPLGASGSWVLALAATDGEIKMAGEIEAAAAAATIRLAELQDAYNNSPDMRIERDRTRLAELQNDPHYLGYLLAIPL